MNLQTIQKRVEELSAELLTLSNDLAFILSGNITREQAPMSLLVIDRQSPWAEDMKAGDIVVCVYVPNGHITRQRSFTVGNTYTVQRRMTGYVGEHFYGVRILEDDEGQGHDAGGVIFAKVPK